MLYTVGINSVYISYQYKGFRMSQSTDFDKRFEAVQELSHEAVDMVSGKSSTAKTATNGKLRWFEILGMVIVFVAGLAFAQYYL